MSCLVAIGNFTKVFVIKMFRILFQVQMLFINLLGGHIYIFYQFVSYLSGWTTVKSQRKLRNHQIYFVSNGLLTSDFKIWIKLKQFYFVLWMILLTIDFTRSFFVIRHRKTCFLIIETFDNNHIKCLVNVSISVLFKYQLQFLLWRLVFYLRFYICDGECINHYILSQIN